MKKEFGSELRRLRMEGGLTMKDLAEAIDCSIAYISDIERGKRNPPSSSDVKKFCHRLGKPGAVAEMLHLAVDSRRSIEIQLGAKSRPEEIDLLLAFKRRIDKGTLSPEDAERLRRLLDEDLAPG